MAGSDGQTRRQRKRAATMARVELIAVDLCMRHGYERVTVRHICESAAISTSAFFNYFGSKDTAILGTSPEPTERAKRRFVDADGPLVVDLIDLLLTGAREAVGDIELFRRRFRLIDASPELKGRQSARIERAQDALTQLVSRRLQRSTRRDSTDLDDRAGMAVALATAIVRHSVVSRDGRSGTDWDSAAHDGVALASSIMAETGPVHQPAQLTPLRRPGRR